MATGRNIKKSLRRVQTMKRGLNVETVAIMEYYIKKRFANSGKKALSDYGIMGKAYEIAVRAYLMNRSKSYGKLRVKPQGKTDITVTINGKTYTCEIKTGCGNIETAGKNAIIIYCPNVDINFPAELQGYVFMREDWIAFLNGYTGRGSFTVKKPDGLHIQSFYVSDTIRPKASKAIARYIENVLYDMPTIAEFFNGEDD